MPAAVAVSGRARAVSSWLSLVERLVFDGGGMAPIAASWSWRVDPRLAQRCGAALGHANHSPPKRRWPPARSYQRTLATPPCS